MEKIEKKTYTGYHAKFVDDNRNITETTMFLYCFKNGRHFGISIHGLKTDVDYGELLMGTKKKWNLYNITITGTNNNITIS